MRKLIALLFILLLSASIAFAGTTNFPNGVSSFGITLPALETKGMFSKYLFVDGTNGSDGNSGISTDQSVRTIAKAITLASRGDVIFIRAKAFTGGTTVDPTAYTENITINVEGLTLCGVSGEGIAPFLPQIKKSVATSPVITVTKPGVTIMNLDINGAGCDKGCIYAAETYSTSGTYVDGLNVINCHIRNGRGGALAALNEATGAYGGITLANAAWYVKVYGCYFYNCRGGVVAVGSGTGRNEFKGLRIENCSFGAETAATIDSNIYITAVHIRDLLIKNCDFTNAIPAFSGAATQINRYVSLAGSSTAVGAIVNCTFADVGLTFGAAGTGATIPTTICIMDCYQEAEADSSGEIGRT